jgi:BirA family transcriptional regulator, biotin operon repressor / biotin---[acetyl-CoA-carboxylase] ligase
VTAVSWRIGHAIHAFATVDSTQAVLARLAGEGAAEGTVVTARHQTAGHGRRGRQWWDAPGESLLMSVLLQPSIPTAQAPQLSLVAGLAVAEALVAAAGVTARIRWPNDVLIDKKKVSGVLPEAVSRADGRVGHVLLGIGINVNQREFPDDLRDEATSLRLATGTAHDPGRLLSPVLDALDRRYGEWLAGGFAGLRQDWRRRASTLGERVRTGDGQEGVAVDVDETGALLVDAGRDGLTRVVSQLGPPSF